ncbi:uncharacterized protein LOC127259743 isoform X2 [Andrographis paniculata]|uniref:uncharacterized protein LOC127259743 isoform X2 n=1 Tax=Andrographis paniculata TaxID=175694 RepID=UPI0021E964C3|nr:uncharacterized protein LOC127259743 isoform X2 [Andrographis paniculata]
MALVSSPKRVSSNISEEEEFEHFDDFTLASSWERFISEIEAVCRQWQADGPKNLLVNGAIQTDLNMGLYKVKSGFKYAMKYYCMEYYFETNNDGEVDSWNKAMNCMQLSFGVKEFVVLAPESKSGMVLDAPEATKLLSAVAIALSNCSCLWPAFVPVHDSSRQAYIGIQNMGTIFTRRFEADWIHSQIPEKLMHLAGLYELFVSKFGYAAMDVSMHHYKVHFKMKITYITPRLDDEHDLQESDIDVSSGETFENYSNGKMLWDNDCPWSEWYTAEDPIKEFTLIAIWPESTAESSLDMAELESASPLEANKWFLYPNLCHNRGTDGNTIGFASQLRLLVEALEISLLAQFMEDFVSVDKYDFTNLSPPGVIPPPIVLDRVLKDLFREGNGTQMGSSPHEHKSSRAIKGAPLDSLFAQCCLHALWFGNCNIRAIAVLWIEFVREVCWCWEESQPLPRMPATGRIDLSTCLINQKLQMLAICIYKKRLQSEEYETSEQDDFSSMCVQVPGELSASHEVEGFGNNNDREELSLASTSMMLLKSCKIMYAPVIQGPPPMTEDMHEERLQAAQALGDSFMYSGQLEKDILASDMSAFKAANPEAVFEDFIRWYSPKDWENENSDLSESSHTNLIKNTSEVEWPPCGRLSERMSDHGNSWRKIWNEAFPLPASKQKPLFDPIREGEKALHYLETLRPHQLLEQMVCTAFSAAVDTLNQTSFGGFKQMTEKMEQLYINIASVLRFMQSYNATQDPDVIGNLHQICSTFEHTEKLLILAASLHRKFLEASHLAEAIFDNYYDYNFLKMKNDWAQSDAEKEFDRKFEVQPQDRSTVADMFTPATTAESWRKDLRMGNLLNGHEPASRELIFSKLDEVSGSYYVSSGSPTVYEQEIETCRMYVCGTSNDLRVSLSVASSD